MSNMLLFARRANKGFTLAELLIALAILGVIATFTIPKILNSSQSGQNTAIAKEAASMVSGAFSAYQLENGTASTVTAGALTTYMNYVAVDTATNYSTTGQQGTALAACTATLQCLKLHNGGIIQYSTNQSLGTGATPGFVFNVDPDGSGVQGAISIIQYESGRLTTGANGTAPTSANGPSVVTADPSYLSNWN